MAGGSAMMAPREALSTFEAPRTASPAGTAALACDSCELSPLPSSLQDGPFCITRPLACFPLLCIACTSQRTLCTSITANSSRRAYPLFPTARRLQPSSILRLPNYPRRPTRVPSSLRSLNLAAHITSFMSAAALSL